MYPLVRLRKLTPDGTVRVSWYCYRLADRAGFVRLFVPSRTRRLHVNGSWRPGGISVVALDRDRPYVVHWWRGEDRQGFYVDTARSIDVQRDTVSYVDLYLDLSFDKGAWSVLDEEELSLASREDAKLARRASDEVRTLVARGDPLFDPDGDPWALPAEVGALRPRHVRKLV